MDKRAEQFFLVATPCDVCGKLPQDTPRTLMLLFLCRHIMHATCVVDPDSLSMFASDYVERSGDGFTASRGISGSITL